MDSIENRVIRQSSRLLNREGKRSPRGINISRFMMGTKWLPQYSSRAKERGLSERPCRPIFFKKSR